MATRNLKPYTLSVVVGSSTLKFPLQESANKYTKEIGDVLGIVETKADDDFNGVGTISGLRDAGVLLTLSVGYKVGDEYKRTKVLCPVDRLATARGQLKTKKMFGNPIVSVGFPGRRSFR